MPPPRVVRLLTRLLVGLQIFLLAVSLLYRMTVYWMIPVAAGDPYDLGDVIELLLYFCMLGTSATTLAVAAVFCALPSLRHWRSIAVLAGAGLATVPAYMLILPHLPKLL
jgi:hypothetical protein